MKMQPFVSDIEPGLPVGKSSRKKKVRRSDRKKMEETFWNVHADSFNILFLLGIALFIGGLVVLIVFTTTNYYAEFRIRHKINKFKRRVNETLELFQRVVEKNQALGYAGLNQHTKIPAHEAPNHEILDAVAPGVGEASFISDGVGLIRTLKILKAGTNVNLNETDDIVTINAVANGTDDFEFLDAVAPNLTDASLISFAFGPTPELKILRSGSNTSITETADVVTINSGDLNGSCNTTCFESSVPVDFDNASSPFEPTFESIGVNAVPDTPWVLYKLGQIVLLQMQTVVTEGNGAGVTGALATEDDFITTDFLSILANAATGVFITNMQTTNSIFISGTSAFVPVGGSPFNANLFLSKTFGGTFTTANTQPVVIPAPGPGGISSVLQLGWSATP